MSMVLKIIHKKEEKRQATSFRKIALFSFSVPEIIYSETLKEVPFFMIIKSLPDSYLM